MSHSATRLDDIIRSTVAAVRDGRAAPAGGGPPPASDRAAPSESPAVLECPVVTRAVLEQLGAVREVVVAASSIVTPLACDYLRERDMVVRRSSTRSARAAAGRPWGYLVDAGDGSALWSGVFNRAGLIALEWVSPDGPRKGGASLPGRSDLDAMADRVVEAAAAVDAQRLPGVLAVTRLAALAACLANKVGSVRAVVVPSYRDFEAVCGTLYPNFVVVPADSLTLHELRGIARWAGAKE
jgi:hypothetical protein